MNNKKETKEEKKQMTKTLESLVAVHTHTHTQVSYQ